MDSGEQVLNRNRIVALLSMIPAAYAEYRIQIQGLFFTGALIGVIFAEIFCSGHLSDWIVVRLSRKNHGQRTPEMRLWLGYPGAILSAIGLALWGASVQQGWHWMVGQVALFLFAVGLQAWQHDLVDLHRGQLPGACHRGHNILFRHHQCE